MDFDFQMNEGRVKLIELENIKEKLKKKRKTLREAEDTLTKIVESKISGKLGMC